MLPIYILTHMVVYLLLLQPLVITLSNAFLCMRACENGDLDVMVVLGLGALGCATRTDGTRVPAVKSQLKLEVDMKVTAAEHPHADIQVHHPPAVSRGRLDVVRAQLRRQSTIYGLCNLPACSKKAQHGGWGCCSGRVIRTA